MAGFCVDYGTVGAGVFYKVEVGIAACAASVFLAGVFDIKTEAVLKELACCFFKFRGGYRAADGELEVFGFKNRQGAGDVWFNGFQNQFLGEAEFLCYFFYESRDFFQYHVVAAVVHKGGYDDVFSP